jgi:hypothetical protein
MDIRLMIDQDDLHRLLRGETVRLPDEKRVDEVAIRQPLSLENLQYVLDGLKAREARQEAAAVYLKQQEEQSRG